MKIDDIVFLNSSAVFAIAIIFLLICLILKKSPQSLGSYKYLMIYIDLFELAYAFLYFLEKPFSREKHNLQCVCYFAVLFVGCFGFSIAILALHFIYRFFSITNNPHLKSFDSWKIVLWFMIPALNGLAFMCTGGILMSADPQTDRFLNENYQEISENTTSLEDLYYVGPLFWPKHDNSTTEQYFSWKAAKACIIAMGVITISSSIMLYFGVKGYRMMSKLIATAGVSYKFKTIQKQLFIALLFQTAIPVFLMHLPATAIYVTIFLGNSKEIIGEIISLTIALYPALNPIPTLFVVKNYRKAIIDAFCYFFNIAGCGQKVVPMTITATASTRNSNILDRS
nr:hypothetical protein T01G6.9 - Caenorhabditis elegans [Caenorhabditis elegans]